MTAKDHEAEAVTVLFAARSATALHRLLDVLPVFAGDQRIRRRFTLVPGSDFGVDALAAIDRAGARTIPWAEARMISPGLTLAASPKGAIDELRGPRVLFPHGAGYNKALPAAEAGRSASGLDPRLLLPGGRPLAALHALAHSSQLDRLTAGSPTAATRAAVIGDPTLDRLLASLSRRNSYRAALGTGDRRLIVLTSTWGPYSLLARHPGLPARLVAQLPHDAYQLALLAHPNLHSAPGVFDLNEQLAPAVNGGLLLARPYEEWAALLVAADAVVTDHGSTALYAAAVGRPLVAACDGGPELIPGTPMAELLSSVPRLESPGDVDLAVPAPVAAGLAFAERGRSLHRLREELYALLALTPPDTPAEARPLPIPPTRPRTPVAFVVRAGVEGDTVRVVRHPVTVEPHEHVHHLAVELDRGTARHAQGAGLLFRRPAGEGTASGPHRVTWTAAGWTADVLAAHPGRTRTAAVALAPDHWIVGRHGLPLLSARIEPSRDPATGLVIRTDPAAVLSAVHAWLSARPKPPPGDPDRTGSRTPWLPTVVRCEIAGRRYQARLAVASAGEADTEV
ncbi:translation initiation factor 2 [Streptomyces sp. DT24]|uniref:translation initiation factor 2 n=1 Tax=Streptomyces sp. DT24 TaxID=3416520 RepID=UPI003CFAE4A5